MVVVFYLNILIFSDFSEVKQFSALDQPVPPPKESTPVPIAGFTFDVRISDFEKKGDGMNAYIVYKLITKSEGVPGISDRTYEVWRRFSDFLGLHDKLFEKYISKGIIVPAAPEKSIAAMTKTKATSDPATSREVAVRRARQLERFMRRVVQHPRLRVDCDVRDFLTMEAELPRASQTATLSGAGVKRMFKSVGEVFSKMAFHMEEGDRWFEQTQSHVEELDESLRKLLHLSESLTSTRKELAGAQESMSKVLLTISFSSLLAVSILLEDSSGVTEEQKMNEEGGYLGAMTYQCLYSGILDKLRSSKRDDDRALAAIHVSVSANQLVFQTSLIVKTVNEKLRR
ncbi:PX domain protein [Ancylostoma ceylanicum]|uniref:PX domain protein n=1 Tax=Ancylostoma ceylanicum TaxID=53326 RepID=A0A0D6L6A6_9BILA|nr:PX domain protein [Ancylostoma ceylanicum]